MYGVDDDKKVIYPLRVSFTLVPDRHVDLLLFERNGIQHYNVFFFISNRTFVFVEKLLKSFAKFNRKVAYWLLNLILKIIRFYRPKLY